MKYFYYLFYLIFIAFAAVQYNDDDSFHWIIAYLFAAFVLFQRQKRNISALALILVAVPYLLWAFDLFPAQWEGLLLNEMGMKTVNIELGRESLGLGFTTLVFVLFYFFDKD